MTLKLFNTLTRKKEEFVPLKEGQVGMYCCGLTVYNFAHVGNLRTYLFEDFLRRILTINGFKVKHVMNITDVGHLTSDADEGEDKMLKGAEREKKTVWEIAEFYTDAFRRDIRKLNILKPTFFPRATDHITEQINLIKNLEEKGFTYFVGGNVYFDTSKLDDYGKLAKLDLTKEGKSRVEKDENKRNKHDFVLWFTKSKFQDQEMKWKSPWGEEGYPGWHMECSAMSMKHLGDQFDIHCGGIDHIPVHHTNEIAQSEAATGKKPWVKYWLHGEFLVIGKGEKMAKSKGNFITLSTFEEKGFSPLDYRYLCLGTHYRKPLMFSYEALEAAKNAREKLNERVLELKSKVDKAKIDYNSITDSEQYKGFLSQINDDMNTPKVLATMWEVLKDEKLPDSDKLNLVLKFDEVLGLGLADLKEEKIPTKIITLAEEREKARKEKDWARADQLRDEIKAKGYEIADGDSEFKIKKV